MVDLAPPSADDMPVVEARPGERRAERAVVGGVAVLLGSRLGIDPLWIRITFVLLTLVGGVGLLVYGALWLALVVGAGPGKRWARVAGGVIVVAGLPLLLTSGFPFLDGPVAVVALLAGLTVALWQPRWASGGPPAGPPPPEMLEHAAVVAEGSSRRTPRQPSILARLTLGLAVLVAAVGALIDQANGGRVHPEQWLGAAAMVCGLGLLVGAFAGRALWLAIPAVALGGFGVISGEAARVGARPTALFGDELISVGPLDPGGVTRREHVVVGRVQVTIDGAPRSPVAVDARVALGEIDVLAPSDVTVEIRSEVEHGTVDVDGDRRSDGTFTVGPEGPPDVVVTAIVGRGDLEVLRYEPDAAPPPPLAPSGPGSVVVVADGVARSVAGNLVLADGDAVLGPRGDVLAGEFTNRGRVTIVTTSIGEFQLLPGGLLLTPYGAVLDLQALPGG